MAQVEARVDPGDLPHARASWPQHQMLQPPGPLHGGLAAAEAQAMAALVDNISATFTADVRRPGDAPMQWVA